MNRSALFVFLHAMTCTLSAADLPSSHAAVNSTGIVAAITLKECFQLALAQSETIKIRQENIEQAKARSGSALGGALPQARWEWTNFRQDAITGSDSGSVSSTLTRKERTESRFVVEQTLFSGLREMNATRGFRREEARDRYNLRFAGVQLFNEVSLAFYDVIRREMILANTKEFLGLSSDRLKEIRERVRLGKSRSSEVLISESILAGFRAQQVQDANLVIDARERLSFLVGKDLSRTPLVDELSSLPEVVSREEAHAKSQSRSDISAFRENVNARRYQVRYEKGHYFPVLDLTGNYYTKRVGFQNEIDWDLLLALDVPIFQGGTLSANVKEAVSFFRQAKLELELLQRQIGSDVNRSYNNFTSILEEAGLREEAFLAAKKSYEQHVKEYRLGLVNNLDVLGAMDNYLNSRREWDDAAVRTRLNYLRLKTIIEEMP